ncbi:MAG: hypothetical protein JKY41_01165 [Rhodobacteraceae bacterium]|nr:hypothetical protein [Paracoccaceae bacterium]
MKAAIPALIALFVSINPYELLADVQKDYEAAAMRLAIAAGCRASYGEYELFEVALAEFERMAVVSNTDITAEELAEMKQRLYATEATKDGNMFMLGFCESLKKMLLPVVKDVIAFPPESDPESVTGMVPEARLDVQPTTKVPVAARPPRRSSNVARTAASVDEAVREAEEAAIRDLLDAALEEASAQVEEPTTVALTGGQRQGIIEAVSRNWNKSIVIGKENFEELVIVLEVSVAPNGMIDASSLKPVEPNNPTGDFEIAYETARRSVLRAGVIPIPEGHFPEGGKLTFTFDPALNTASLK